MKKYERVDPRDSRSPHKFINAKDIKVGHILKINSNERIPADMLLLQTAEERLPKPIKACRFNEEQVACIAMFAARVANMHSWHRDLNRVNEKRACDFMGQQNYLFTSISSHVSQGRT